MKPFSCVQVWIAVAAILVTGAKALSADDNVWTRIGPEGGNIQRLLVDPQDPDTLYARRWRHIQDREWREHMEPDNFGTAER